MWLEVRWLRQAADEHRAGAHSPRRVQLCRAAVLLSATSLSSCTRAVTWSRCTLSCHPNLTPIPMHHHLHCSSRPVAVKLALKGALLAELDTDHVGYLCEPSGWCMGVCNRKGIHAALLPAVHITSREMCVMLQTFAANHRLTSEDVELFPSRESSFVRGSGSSFGGRSRGSFTGPSSSRTAGPPNLQRFSGAPPPPCCPPSPASCTAQGTSLPPRAACRTWQSWCRYQHKPRIKSAVQPWSCIHEDTCMRLYVALCV